MIRVLAFRRLAPAVALLAAALAACQSIVGASGQFQGITVPPGCKAQGQAAFGGLSPPAGSIQFECDETKLPVAPATAPRIELK